MIISVSDPHDPRLDPFRWRDRELASRAERTEKIGAGLFVAEGDLVVDRAFAARCTPVALLCDDELGKRYATENPDLDVFVADEALRREVTGLGVPLRATGLFIRPALHEPDDLVATSHRIVVAEAVDNPTNLGAIIRSAVALGWDAVLLSHGSADPLARRALRVSMGTGLILPFARLDAHDSVTDLCARHHCDSYGLTPAESALNIDSVHPDSSKRIALLLGSERDGLRDDTMKGAHTLVRIPMHAGVDSLNVGAAAAIALHALGPRGRRG